MNDRHGRAGADDASALESIGLPPDVNLVRTTPEFTAASVPTGLLAAHHVADGVWGRLRVRAGRVDYVVEETGQSRTIGSGESQVIEPGVRHRVQPHADARFALEFHR